MPTGGYESTPTGMAWLQGQFKAIWKAIDSIRSSAGILSAIIGKGGVRIKDGGSLSISDGGSIWMEDGGKFFVAGDTTYVQILDDSFSIGTVAAGGALTRPSMIMRPDGFLAAISDTDYAVFRVDATDGAAVITSSTGTVRLPYTTTGSAANTRILLDGSIQMVTSSLRYKQDVEDADFDPMDLLDIRGRTWRQKADVEADPETTHRNVGFIAEELHDAGLGLFVEYDEQRRPDAIQYDRLAVALLELAKADHATIVDQQSQLDIITARLDALESDN